MTDEWQSLTHRFAISRQRLARRPPAGRLYDPARHHWQLGSHSPPARKTE